MIVIVVIVVVTGGKQSQLLAFALGLGWSLTIKLHHIISNLIFLLLTTVRVIIVQNRVTSERNI